MSIHGGNIIATAKYLGCEVADLIDMSSNLTPLGMVPGLKEALVEGLAEIAYLPETDSETLRQVFSRKYGVAEDEVLVGNGTTEFIFALPRAFAWKRAIIVNPTYSDYRLACEWAGVPVISHLLASDRDFLLDLEELAAQLSGAELVFICNPNNPTASLTGSRNLHELVATHPATTFLVDESYLPFTREESLLAYDVPPNLFILCSSSKIYGIPGLRLGFLVSSAGNLKMFASRQKPWGVNRLAQLAGRFLLENGDPYVEEVVSYVESERPRFVAGLSAIEGIRPVAGRANFILARLPEGVSASWLRNKLLEKRIMIRDCATFEGLDRHYFRMSLKSRAENDHCLEQLKEVLKEKRA